jgi:hypothetical protein
VVYLYHDAVDVIRRVETGGGRTSRPCMDNAWLFNETQRRANEVGALPKPTSRCTGRSPGGRLTRHRPAVDLLGADRAR